MGVVMRVLYSSFNGIMGWGQERLSSNMPFYTQVLFSTTILGIKLDGYPLLLHKRVHGACFLVFCCCCFVEELGMFLG